MREGGGFFQGFGVQSLAANRTEPGLRGIFRETPLQNTLPILGFFLAFPHLLSQEFPTFDVISLLGSVGIKPPVTDRDKTERGNVLKNEEYI